MIVSADVAHMRRQLALITLLVVGAHLWLLRHANDIVQPGLPGAERLVTRPMQTRQIAPDSARAGDAAATPGTPNARVSATLPSATTAQPPAPAARASAISLQAGAPNAPSAVSDAESKAGAHIAKEPVTSSPTEIGRAHV